MTANRPSDEELLEAAREAAGNAYSPYSKVRVGVALLAEDGRVFRGCNVENASYGLTICGERTAVVRAIAEGARRFTAIAISSSPAQPLPPCGACRQVLREFAPGLRVIYEGGNGERVETTIEALLPGSMGPRDLSPEDGEA